MTNSESYILFIDESGKSKLTDAGDVFYLTGVIINKNLHTALSSYMISLKGKSGIPSDNNLHAFDLLENEKIRKKKIVYKKIDQFFERLLKLVEGSDMRVITVMIDKTPYLNAVKKIAAKKKSTIKAVVRYLNRSGLNDFLYESLVRKLVLEFGHFLDQQGSTGEIIAESRRDGDHAVVNGFMRSTSKSTYLPNTINHMWSDQSFDHIFGLTFQNKRGLSYGLEVADMFAWTVLNKQYFDQYGNLPRPCSSKSKQKRVLSRLNKLYKHLPELSNKAIIENITPTKLKTLSQDLISEFNNLLKQYKLLTSGISPSNLDEP